MHKPRRSTLLAALVAVSPFLLLWPTLGYRSEALPQKETLSLPQRDALSAPEPPTEGTRGPAALAFTQDGKTLYVAEQDENRVAIVEADTGNIVTHIPSGGQQPTGLALTSDGGTLVAANTFSGDIGLIDMTKRTLRKTVPLRGMPRGIAVIPDGHAFIAMHQLDQIAVMDTKTGQIEARIETAHQPRVLTLLPNKKTLLCIGTNGTLSLIDTGTRKELTRLKLPAVNLRGAAITQDGQRALITGQIPNNEPPTEKTETMWTNVLMTVHLDGTKTQTERILTLDTATDGAADPWDVVTDGDNAYISIAGAHEVYTVSLKGSVAAGDRARSGRRIPVGTNPRALALRPHAAELWVCEHLGNALRVLPTSGIAPVSNQTTGREVTLGSPTPSPNRRLRGRFLFASAHIVRGRKFTCETCHPDMREDGLNWKFAHVKDEIGERSTRDLRGRVLLTAPYGWGGRVEDFEDFVNEEVVGLLRTRKLNHDDVHAIWDLVNETPLPPNPYRNSDGTFTETAMRGKALFYGQAGCIKCHEGDVYGGTNKREWIGTTPTGQKLDVPHLEAVYDSAPYLHDGRAATLEEVFTKYNTTKEHGKAHLLNPEQLADLIAFVRQL